MLSLNVFSKIQDSHNPKLNLLVEKVFFAKGNLNKDKVESYEKKIRSLFREVKENLYKYNHRSSSIDIKNLKKKKLKKYGLILHYIKKLKNEVSDTERKKIGAIVLELAYSIKVEGTVLQSVKTRRFIINSLKNWSFSKKSRIKETAVNLYNFQKKKYYSFSELRDLKKEGKDLSKLQPRSSSFWENTVIETIDVRKFYNEGQHPLYKGVSITFPSKHAFFKKVRKTQSKPKLDIIHYVNGKKVTFKLKIGSEMHSEITSSALFTTLGYPVDLSRYARNFKMSLGKMTPKRFKEEWNSYFFTWDVEKYIKKVGRDKNGNYIIWKEVLIETKPKNLNRIGAWAWGENGHRGMREVRGILLFNMWVSNLDLKESENNKLIYKDMNGKQELFHLQHDLGFAFGKRYREKIGDFPWVVVTKSTKKKIKVNFHNFQKNSGFKNVTFDDARWMIRRIARLTRKQIEAAVSLGGWPESLKKLLTEKLISRRNNLIRGFDLTDEFDSIPYDRKLTTRDGSVVEGDLKKTKFKGHAQDFGREARALFIPILDNIQYKFIKSIVWAESNIPSYNFEPIEFGLDDAIIAKIIFNVGRSITRNPHPKGADDLFLTKDTLKIGFRLGYGLVASGDISYVKKYTLVYPKKTRLEAEFNNRNIFNLLLPLHVLGNKLPPKSVLIVEDSVEGRGRLKLGGNTLIPLGVSSSVSEIVMRRLFLDFKDPKKVSIFSDKVNSTEAAFKIYSRLLLFKFPILKMSSEIGHHKRVYYTLAKSDYQKLSSTRLAIRRALEFGDIKGLEEKSIKSIVTSDFTQRRRDFRLFKFFRYHSSRRLDYVTVKKEKKVDIFSQLRSNKRRIWSYRDNGEDIESQILLTGKKGDGDELKAPLLTMKLSIEDSNTTSSELEKYINFSNEMAGSDQFISFSPAKHSKNKLWGHTINTSHIIIYKEGLDAIAKSGPQEVWKALAKVTSKPLSYWTKKDSHLKRLKRKVRKKLKGKNYEKYDRRVRRHIKKMIRHLGRIKSPRNTVSKMRKMMNAIRPSLLFSGGTYQGEMIGVLLELAGKNNFYMNSLMKVVDGKENKFPVRAPLYNEKGEDRLIEYEFFKFDFEDSVEIYNFMGAP